MSWWDFLAVAVAVLPAYVLEGHLLAVVEDLRERITILEIAALKARYSRQREQKLMKALVEFSEAGRGGANMANNQAQFRSDLHPNG